ncbi:hypothetical protein NSQ26_14425 [Bacillus sp. FSL W7-1360]
MGVISLLVLLFLIGAILGIVGAIKRSVALLVVSMTVVLLALGMFVVVFFLVI